MTLVRPLIRYSLSFDLVSAFSRKEIEKSVTLLKETDRFSEPNGGTYSLRYPRSNITPFTFSEGAYKSTDPETNRPTRKFDEVDFQFGRPVAAYSVVQFQYPGIPAARKRVLLDNYIARGEDGVDEKYRHLAQNVPPHDQLAFWEPGGWVTTLNPIIWDAERDGNLLDRPGHSANVSAKRAHDMLLISLADRSVSKVETEQQSKKWKKFKLGGVAPPREIVLYCPGRLSDSLGGTHASPRMHYRSPHTRLQRHGKGLAESKMVSIEATWVNREEVDPSELEPPPRFYTLKP